MNRLLLAALILGEVWWLLRVLGLEPQELLASFPSFSLDFPFLGW